jgi:hypothetical protein
MFSDKLMNGIQRQAIIRLPATLMICSMADLLSGTIHSIKQRIKARTQEKKPIEGFFKEKEPEQDQRPIV